MVGCRGVVNEMKSGKRCVMFFFQAEDGIRDLVRSRGLGDVYKRQVLATQLLLVIIQLLIKL